MSELPTRLEVLRPLPERAAAALRAGKNVEAVKPAREELGLDLKDAYELVRSHEASQARTGSAVRHAGREETGAGRLLLIAAVFAIVVIAWWMQS